jgi:hypothetical protein
VISWIESLLTSGDPLIHTKNPEFNEETVAGLSLDVDLIAARSVGLMGTSQTIPATNRTPTDKPAG